MTAHFLEGLFQRGLISRHTYRNLLQDVDRLRVPFGLLARTHGLLTCENIDAIFNAQQDSNKLFGEIAVEMGLLIDSQVALLLDIQEFQLTCTTAQALAVSGEMGWGAALAELSGFISRRPGEFQMHSYALASV
jgi:hypothetical protein